MLWVPSTRRGFCIRASLAGWVPILYMAAYNASKFAVVAFTEVLAHEHRDSNVKVLCVCPPPVRTPLLDQARDTVWPKVFDQGEHIEAQDVLDAISDETVRDLFAARLSDKLEDVIGASS